MRYLSLILNYPTHYYDHVTPKLGLTLQNQYCFGKLDTTNNIPANMFRAGNGPSGHTNPSPLRPSTNRCPNVYGKYANSIDPDQTPHSAASDQAIHCLPHIQRFLDTSVGCKMELFKFEDRF